MSRHRHYRYNKPQHVGGTSAPIPTPPSTPNPTPIPIPSPPLPSTNKICINYGHYATSYDLSTSGRVAKDLAILANAGITSLRLAYIGWNNPQSEALAVFAKSKGFRVVLGGDWDTLSPDQENAYTSEVLQEAAWAQAHGIDQFSVGNEQEYRLSGMSQREWHDFITGLATQVKQVLKGVVSYETSGDFADFWAGQSLGGLDLIGFNLYAGYGANSSWVQKNVKAHGQSHVYVSETNADMDTGDYNDDATHAQEVTGDALKLTGLGIPIYYFTFATNNSNGVANHWGLYQNSSLAQPLTAGVLGIT
jgi:hypothetical protein